MAEYVTLLGAESVGSAGIAMRQASGEMIRAASMVDEALMRNQRFMDDWLERLANTLAAESKEH